MSEANIVHVFLSLGRFVSAEEVRGYVDPSWTEEGDVEVSALMREAGIAELEPMCVEVIHAVDAGHDGPVAPVVLLREASYANQWLTQVESTPVESTQMADSAICVFTPNLVTTPRDTSLRYLGRFTYLP